VEERQLEITINEVPFRVDSKRGRLIEVSNPQNQIRKQDLKDEGSWYRTIFDKKTNNIYKGWLEYGVPNFNVIPLSIPKMLFYPTLASDTSLITEFRLECRRACRGFEVIGSKPAIAFQKIGKKKEQKSSADEKRRIKTMKK